MKAPRFERSVGSPASAIAALLFAFALAGCGSPPPVLEPPVAYQHEGWVAEFNSADWQLVLTKVATPGGYVRWDTLKADAVVRDALMRYVRLIGRVSPENRPDLFQTRADQLAYWINSYNAVCMYGVLLRNETNPPALYAMDLFSFGGHALTLNQIEQTKIRPLNDPRAVFAINRATHSSPPLRSEPYDGLKLNAQLVDQGKTFLNDSRGVVRVDDVAKVNDLLTINYAPDFLAAYQKKYSRPGEILQAIAPYAEKHSLLAGAKQAVPMGYDASLNRP